MPEVPYRVIHSNTKLFDYRDHSVCPLSSLRLADLVAKSLSSMEYWGHFPCNTKVRYGGFLLGTQEVVPFWSDAGFEDALKEVIWKGKVIKMLTVTLDFDDDAWKKVVVARNQRFREKRWREMTPEEVEWKERWYKPKPKKEDGNQSQGNLNLGVWG